MNINIPNYVNIIIERLESSSFEAYCVGGCVRDSIIGKSPSDWDIATSATPDEVKVCFRDFSTHNFGEKHGTVTVMSDNKPIEITTFREEGTYHDFRHPDSVAFSKSLKVDLSRRDFTINAMAFNKKDGLVDLFGGVNDLESKTIKCVGEARLRFSEDALRILRALRFASQLDFTIEEKTIQAANEASPLLKRIARERISEEFKKLILGKSPDRIIREYSEMFFLFLPELAPMVTCEQENPYHIYSVWEHTLHALSNTPRILEVRLAALFHDIGKPSCKTYGTDSRAHFYSHSTQSAIFAESAMKRLHFSNELREKVVTLISNHDIYLPLSEKKIKKLLSNLGIVQLYNLYYLVEADISAQKESVFIERIELLDEAREKTRLFFEAGACISVSDLEITGNDLLTMGYKEGKDVGDCLKYLLELVIDDKIENNHSILMEKARVWLESNS